MAKKFSDAYGPVLRRIRNEKGLTQDRLSELAGVSPPFISMLESGHNYPSLEMVFQLGLALEVRPSSMFAEMEQRLDWPCKSPARE